MDFREGEEKIMKSNRKTRFYSLGISAVQVFFRYSEQAVTYAISLNMHLEPICKRKTISLYFLFHKTMERKI